MITFKNVTKAYKDKEVLHNINLTIPEGEIVSIIGSSGCGKTTLLKMINRLIPHTSGDIFLDGQNITSINPVDLRLRIGYVVQQTGLFVHLTIRENLELVLKLHNYPKKEWNERIMNIMKLVGLSEDFLDRYSPELSGGQQQRVGVARALLVEPDVILMDEPFSALDPITREVLQDELRSLEDEMHKTIVFVTHDMDEAIKISDRICLMRDGQIEQYDTPEQILRNPATPFVEEFIGKNRIWSSPEFIKAKDIMIRAEVFCYDHDTIISCYHALKKADRKYMVVFDPHTNALEGIITRYRLQQLPHLGGRASEIMEPVPLTVHESDSLPYVLKQANEKEANFIAVVNDNSELQGFITENSMLDVIGGQYYTEENEATVHEDEAAQEDQLERLKEEIAQSKSGEVAH